jgi:hypothetical protein
MPSGGMGDRNLIGVPSAPRPSVIKRKNMEGAALRMTGRKFFNNVKGIVRARKRKILRAEERRSE